MAAVAFGATLAGLTAIVATVSFEGARAAATTERIGVDRHTGLAISGFDPVAYFTDGQARIGQPEHEHQADGVTWRFRNEGNLAAFAADPEVYMPQFGGYDPTGVARGTATPGHPRLWLIHDRRLYLFFSEAARKEFAADPNAIADRAEDRWAEVLRTLVP